MSHKHRATAVISALQAELKSAQKAAKHWEVLATTDDLTGLHNRRMLGEVDKRIEERRLTSSEHQDLTLLFIDLDDFGQLNKKYGDNIGDDALRLLGETIRQNIRKDDIAIRKGGDEFVIILMGSTPELASQTVVKRLQLLLDGALSVRVSDHLTVPIRGSIGAFEYNPYVPLGDNLKHADTLMRLQKMERKADKAKAGLPCPSPSLFPERVSA